MDIYKGLSLLLFNIVMTNFSNVLKSMLSTYNSSSYLVGHYSGKGSKHSGEENLNSKRS